MIDLVTVLALSLPPVQYDHEPVTSYQVEYVSEQYMLQMGCRGERLVGCTLLRHYVLLNERLTPDAAAYVLRHEKGHVNGWQHR